MKGKVFLVFITVLCFLFCLFGCIAWGNSAHNRKKINEVNYKKHPCEVNVITYTTTNGKTVELTFGKNSVQVANSYTLEHRSERLEIAVFIVKTLQKKKIHTTQTTTDYMGELAFHYACYHLNIKPKQAAHADLEYLGDSRLMVQVASKILAVLGF